ncbi:hypothetical protein CK203_017793 [Vitis vinifera]|uniref:DUF659 domain-containing protein n=1 Tax=Vitis vinifera TaxID=29760 RepID=A0A438JHA8_VITVI|nr:hypothetical protein CK203_017793 [Vitis vinifera]
MKVEKLLMKKFNFYWTPCAVHYINLIFEDIGKRPSVTDVINNVRKVTTFIYNHDWLLTQMRKYCGGDIVQPGVTRFQYNHGVGSDPELPQVVHDVFAKLDPTTESLNQFGNEVDSTSASHISRPSVVGSSTFGYDGSRCGIDEGGDNAGRDIWECQQSQYPMSQFTCENDFTHCTHDEDHDSRKAGPGIGAIGKLYRGRERTMKSYNEELLSRSFESMSLRTQFSDSSNEANIYPPHMMSYGQPSSSTNEEYGMLSYTPSAQISYQVPYQMEGRFDINIWVNLEYPIHVEVVSKTQEIYVWHVKFLTNIIEAH